MEWFCIATAAGLALAGVLSALLLVRRWLRRRRHGPYPAGRTRLRRLAARAWLAAQVGFVLAAVIPLGLPSGWIVTLLSAEEDTAEIDAVVVLGGGLTPDRRLGITTRERLDRAIDLGAGRIRVYVSGGPGTGPRMSEYLTTSGLPLTSIEMDNASYFTEDNVKNLCPALRAARHRCVGIVTSPFHSGRALALFRDRCPGVRFSARSTAPSRLFGELSWLSAKTALVCEGAKRVYAAVFQSKVPAE